jgi:hypothetical protein
VALNANGELLLQTWSDSFQDSFNLSGSLRCGAYAFCSEFSICNETAVEPCDCLQGFKPNAAQGCKRKTDLSCSDVAQNHDGFLRMSKVYLPSNCQQLHVGNALEFESACLKNCNCTGYAYDQEHRCQVWEGPLLNLKKFSAEDNTFKKDFYLKLARPDLVPKGISLVSFFFFMNE